jgi:UbiD family decarboxylase
MAFAALRDFYRLDQEGQLLRIKGEAPALLFEKLHGYTGARVVMNVHGSWNNHALMLDMPKNP